MLHARGNALLLKDFFLISLPASYLFLSTRVETLKLRFQRRFSKAAEIYEQLGA